jgi:hypothetical protein
VSRRATGGFFVPSELADAVRTGLQIIGQPVAVPLESELTDWIDGSVKPRIVGVYQRDFSFCGKDDMRFCKWDGDMWLVGYDTVTAAAESSHSSNYQRVIPWRGLRHDPTRGVGA